MAITISEGLSIAALFLSLVSLYHSYRQNQIARSGVRTDSRGYASESHREYRDAIRRVREKHRESNNQLMFLAGEAARSIVHVMDDFNVGNNRPRRLGHLVHEAAEMICSALTGQLGWQTGANMRSRLYDMRYVEETLNPDERQTLGLPFRQHFQREHERDPNTQLEMTLVSDPAFCDLVRSIKKRLDPAKSGELLNTIDRAVAELRTLHNSLSPRIEETVRQLEDLLDDIESEPLPVANGLRRRLRVVKTKLETLGAILIPTVAEEDAGKYANYTSLSVLYCATSLVIQSYFFWGYKVDGSGL